MIVVTPVDEAGHSAESWGRAQRVAVAEVSEGVISRWEEHHVGWDVSHDAGSHGSHHARVVRFLRDHGVEAVVVFHMGEGMVRVLGSMGIPILTATEGDARASVLAAVAG